MVAPIPIDDVELSGGIFESLDVGPGTYLVRKGDDAVTYSVGQIYIWECFGENVCSQCESMRGIHGSSPGTSGSVHPNCRCQVTQLFIVVEIGRRQGADCARCDQFFYTSDMKGAYCLDCLEIIREALKDAASGSFWMGIVLTGGAIIVAFIPAPGARGAAFVLGAAGLSAFGMDRYATDAAADPPDESYKELVEIMEVDLDLEPVEEEVSNLRIMEAVKATINVIANLDACRRSMEKFAYAASVFDRKYISLHGKSVIKYREGVITSLQELIESFQTFGSTLKDTPFDIDLKPENINELQTKLEAGGFDEQQINVLQKLGLDTDAINELKEKIINTDSSKFTGKLNDFLNRFVTEIGTFKNNMISIGH
ncbi:MAG: hypothetical protein GTO45_36110 [Candidatus Aminicenantes bacterium]|nr:hypothetical protein [Candidatus Aminicenantes bacterium]NIM84126.1 hypothetical protein [Candidatus Aminicenantes bacterium]NIN23574.1 hypothetical protein [Candidatus Aminicenantes bacterium]NIN47281.1 hypothetical protein [Candidatus Aminicenantes bacterium]NIN90210.1 hypothetical protein [Candidatus Aminicenantes bacterium]